MNPVDVAEQVLARKGHAHFIGVGGIGMAGVAFLLKQRGWTVSGCDRQQNRQTQWLLHEGIEVLDGHAEAHVAHSVDWLIRTTAVSDSHPEVVAAQRLGIPVSRRGEVLPALLRDRYTIAVSGTHGKTTTTAMIAHLLECGFCVGGEMAGVEGVARDGDMMVVEADESDGTVAGYTPDLAVITNIEFDHMEHHADERAFCRCFEQLIQQTREQVYYCAEDAISDNLCAAVQEGVRYGMPDEPIVMPLRGRHNQLNASVAREVARRWLSDEVIAERFETLAPVRRRFETVYSGGGIQVISDYAHHPTEIRALIRTAQELKQRPIVGIFQPHRYTRTLALAEDFSTCLEGLERCWITPVYAASEEPIEGGTTEDLMVLMPDYVEGSPSLEAAWSAAMTALEKGGILLIIGAGDIEQLAERARLLTV